METPTLSVVLISHNEKEYLSSCLKSLTESCDSLSCEIIWVDNGSTDGSAEYVKRYFSSVISVFLKTNHGVSYARNRALEKVRGEFVLILDVDTIPNTEAIEGMIRYLREHSECGLCGCRLTDVEGVRQESYKRFPDWRFKANNIFISLVDQLRLQNISSKLTRINRRFTYGDQRIDLPFTPDYVIGACQMFRRSLLSEVGLLDEQIFYGPEDADFCLRITQKGYSVVYLPSYSIIHHWRRSSSRKPFSGIAWKHLQGLIYFYRKWKFSRY